jgi:peptide/nickel transport system ATP-binding protein
MRCAGSSNRTPSAVWREDATMSAPLLNVERLSVRFGTTRSPLGALRGASFHVERGETVCLVGESGCGKTITALSILRLEPYRKAQIVAGDVVFEGQGLRDLGRDELDRLRGRRISMIFQEPMTAFDPLFSIGDQIVEAILRHEPLSREAARARALLLLKRVRIPDPELRMKQIPEELSGGMRQRAMIAMALSCKPDLLIADEPTTALDVTIQAQILALLKDIQREDGMGILLITHDLGVAAEMADRIVVMYAGRVVEHGPAKALFARPEHPYTRALLHSAIPHEGPRKRRLQTIQGSMPRLEDMPGGCSFHPRCPEASERCTREEPELIAAGNEQKRELACFNAGVAERITQPQLYVVCEHEQASTLVVDRDASLLEARHLSKHFDVRAGLFGGGARVFALDDVSLSIARGETLGLVGESGCGKSTLGRILVQLERPSAGEIHFDGRDLGRMRSAERKRLRRDMQMIFQDPYDSIDPRFSVFEVVAEPLRAQDRSSAQGLRTRVSELLEQVGLPTSTGARYARELSGGQRQRVGIARAIALSPKFIVADEAVSALDLSVQAQILNLLADLREKLGLTSLFIGHGLNVVRHVSDRIGVMYLGRLVEVGDAEELFRRPLHHYTAALLASIPAGFSAQVDTHGPKAVAPLGELPSPSAPPSGCHFHPRCPAASARCREEAPRLSPLASGRLVACHAPVGA